MLLHWSDHLLFIIVGIIIPLRTVLGTQPQLANMRFNTRMKIQLYWGNNLWLWLLCGAVAGVWWFNDRSWELIGLKSELQWPTGWPLIVFAVFALLYVWDTISEVNSQQHREMTAENLQSELGFLPTTGYEYFHFIFLALTAGICEEFIFRGYFIRYFQCLLGSEETYTLAILLPALIFGVVHFYQGWRAVVKITAMAIMFGYVFVHTGSLWVLMMVHAVIDLLGGLIAWQLLRRR
ncbi:MAG: CPBP family intramembrane glutamic endopeptidase [Lewinella sp.]|jgi:membrane protease YdiL (CAAX protease family)|uniref:CPBP family intramembrane glutamic endopeptidase n=1 Tax=Lewinella sp. TaxID=2004506 RepID=UPI003D6BE073